MSPVPTTPRTQSLAIAQRLQTVQMLAESPTVPEAFRNSIDDAEWTAMSVPERVNAIDFLREEQQATTEGVTVTFPRWKFPTSGSTRFTMETPDGETLEATELRGIVVFKMPGRAYYAPDAPISNNPPLCASSDTLHPDVSPSPVTQATTCAACPMSQWSSGKNGRGQACKLRLRTFLIRDGKPIPEYISLPPTALKPFGAYAVQLRQLGTPLIGVETVFGLTKQQNRDGIAYTGLTLKVGGKLKLADMRAARAAAEAFDRHMKAMGITVEETAGDEPEVLDATGRVVA